MPFKPSRHVFAAIAIVAVAAGLAAVYVTERGAVESGGRCAAAAPKAAALRPFATGELAALLPADTPADFSDLALRTPDGGERHVSELAGQTLILNMWATWCVPCRAEMPHLQALQEKRGRPDFSVVALNVDVGGQDRPTRFLKEIGATSLIDLRDPEMRAFNELKSKGLVLGLPTTFVVNRQGCVLASLAGPAKWDSPAALALIEAVAKPD
ncbi:TlpA disulfide reductase family protein [Pleomorphomonas sp. PLEO]|uniref:thiol:disulfide interchange protein TlpA n=1 Tax=Pleomorphomonas sp. PLEO TaxID=3239306 RepID=UPI00351F17D5